MKKWLLGGFAGLVLIIRGFFADRKAAKLTKERDTSMVGEKVQSIKAEAKAIEAEQAQKRQEREDARNAANTDTLRTERDNLFK